MRRAAVAAVGVALATAAPLAGYRAGLYPDAPPPATTGGFGEPTCVSCHFAPTAPDTAGSLAVEGLPRRYRPGHRYELTVALDRPGMKRAGFQLSARVAEGPDCGTQAGRFEVFDPVVAVTAATSVQYVHQTSEGAMPDAQGRARWTFRWTAPEKPRRVVFHVAANAANGDDSALGDVVFAIEREVPPAADRTTDDHPAPAPGSQRRK